MGSSSKLFNYREPKAFGRKDALTFSLFVPSRRGVQESSTFNRYAPPISVLAKARPLTEGLKMIPGTNLLLLSYIS